MNASANVSPEAGEIRTRFGVEIVASPYTYPPDSGGGLLPSGRRSGQSLPVLARC